MSTKTAIPTWAQTWILTAIALFSNADAELKPLRPVIDSEREHVNEARAKIGAGVELLRVAMNESEDLAHNGTEVAG